MSRLKRLNPYRAGVLLLAVSVSACAMGPKHSVMLGLTHVAYVEKGSEAPPVIFEAGMGDGLETWEPVFDEVAASARAIAYSRPGYAGGFYRRESDGKRSADDEAEGAGHYIHRDAPDLVTAEIRDLVQRVRAAQAATDTDSGGKGR